MQRLETSVGDKLARGEISFDQFARETAPYWSARANSRQYRGAGYDPDDVRQEMLIEAWKAYKTFDPERGALIPRLSTSAYRRMCRIAAKWRRKWTVTQVDELTLERIVGAEPEPQVDQAARKEAFERLALALRGAERACIHALAQATDAEEAVQCIWDDRFLSWKLKLKSREQAAEFFEGVLVELVARGEKYDGLMGASGS